MTPIHNAEVTYGPVQMGDLQGIRLMFKFGENGPVDLYEFFEPDHVTTLWQMITEHATPDSLMLAIRYMTHATLH